MLPDDQIRFLLATLYSIPLSLLLRYIPSTVMRQYFSIIVSSILQFYVYSHQLWMCLIFHCIIYGLIIAKGRQCGAFITILSTLTLSAYHIYRMYVDYGGWQIDVSIIFMLHVSKYSYFAYAYQDGGEQLDKITIEHRKIDRLQILPSFIDYIGYLQFLPTAILNTPFQFVRYRNYINQTQQFANIPLLQSFKKAGSDLAIGVFCAAIYILQMIYIPISYIKTQGFLDHNVFYILHYTFWSIWLIKFKYYFGWKFSQLSVHISGVSYEPKKDCDNFLGVQTCNPYEIESTIHLRDKISNWNMAVQQWLRKCVYERLPMSKTVGQMVTFAISAFWHGFYEGYYLTFLFWFAQLYVSGLIFKWSNNKQHPVIKLYNKYNPYSYYFIWVFWNWLFAHNGMYFHLLDYHNSFAVLWYFKYCSPIIMLLLAVWVIKFGKQRKRSQKINKQKEIVGKGQ